MPWSSAGVQGVEQVFPRLLELLMQELQLLLVYNVQPPGVI